MAEGKTWEQQEIHEERLGRQLPGASYKLSMCEIGSLKVCL